MKCPTERNEDAEVLLDYCAQRLNPKDAASVEQHLAVCDRCTRLVNAQRAVWEALDHWEPAAVSTDFNRRLYARIDAEEAESGMLTKLVRTAAARCSLVSWRPLVPVAAICAVLIAALFINTPNIRSTGHPREPEVRFEKVDIEQVERTLDDLDMLKQLSPAVAPPNASTHSM